MRLLAIIAVALLAAAASAGEPACQVRIGTASVTTDDVHFLLGEAHRRLDWALQSLEAARPIFRDGAVREDGQADPRRALTSLVNVVVRPWLDLKESVCGCFAAPPARCQALDEDRARLVGLLPRSGIRRPPDVDRLIKGR